MDIIRTVHNLQQKPASVRRRILIGTVSISMATIAAFWLMAVSRKIETATPKPPALTASANRAIESPFKVFEETISESWQELQMLLK